MKMVFAPDFGVGTACLNCNELCKRHKWHCEVCQKDNKCCICNTYLFKQCYYGYNSASLLCGFLKGTKSGMQLKKE